MSSNLIADPKLVILSLFNTHWDDNLPPAGENITNLPAKSTITFGSSPADRSKTEPSVIVGEIPGTEDEWIGVHDKLYKRICPVEVYHRVTEANPSNTSLGKVKQQRFAITENIRLILEKYSNRPDPTIMFLLPRDRFRDFDNLIARPVILRSIMQAEAWYVNTIA